MSILTKSLILVILVHYNDAFLGRGTLLEEDGDVFGIYCDDFDRNTRVWHHREITREAVRRSIVQYFKEVAPPSGTYNHRDGMTLEEAYSEYYGANASPRPFLHALASIVDSVAEADTGALGSDPRYHFGSERFSEAQSILGGRWRRIVNAGRTGDYSAARHLLGLSLAAVQDFYSHTNWVELGHDEFNKDVGVTGIEIQNVAEPQESTCRDCPEGADGVGSCKDNLLKEGASGGTLTSGYSSEARVNGARLDKPRGVDKCSHGGPRDSTRGQGARGGINKDLPTACFSPHNHLHQQAAEQAVEATEFYLKLLRGSLGRETWSRLLALPPSTPAVVMVLDTTDSMQGQLDALRQTFARIVQRYDNEKFPPSEYLLVPFNDPLYGPVFRSSRPDQIYDALQRIRVGGGGDEPEVIMSALSLALHHAPPHSRVFLFTDASVKDPELYPAVLAMALHKAITITTVLTRPVRDGGLRGRFDLDFDLSAEYLDEYSDIDPRTNNQPLSYHQQSHEGLPDLENNTSSRIENATKTDIRGKSRVKRQLESLRQYTDLTRKTGGHLVQVPEDRLKEVTRILETQLLPQALLWREFDIVSDRKMTFPVDSLIQDLNVAISGGVSKATLQSPSGTKFDLMTQGDDQSYNGFSIQVFTPLFIQARVNMNDRGDGDYGDWTLEISPSGSTVTVLITALSTLDLLPALYIPDHNAAQPSLQRVVGQPARGSNTYLDLVLTGVDTAKLRRVEEGELVEESEGIGSTALPLPTPAPRRNTYLHLSPSTLPSGPFSVALQGIDAKGKRFRRESESSGWEDGEVFIRFPLGRDIWGPPGSVLRIPIEITSAAPAPVTLFLAAHDAKGAPVTLDKTRVNLGRNDSTQVLATLLLDRQTPTPSTSTLTLTTTTNGGRIARSLAHVTSDYEYDTTPPTCEVDRKTSCKDYLESSNCDDKDWSASLSFRDDVGVFYVQSEPRYTFANFESGAKYVSLTYRASCCDPLAIITVTDMGGNTDYCDIDNTEDGDINGAKQLSTGEIAGITVGVILAIILIVALVAFLVIRHKKKTGKEEVTEVRRRRRLSAE